MSPKFISGFSKLSREEKLKIISSEMGNAEDFISDLNSLNHNVPEKQTLMEQFSENTLGNFPLPYSIAPNFLINNKFYNIPMVTEESSVVAAASSAARFWADKGGFHAKVKATLKTGQIHFCWYGPREILYNSQDELKKILKNNSMFLAENMMKRGGGIIDIELIDFSDKLENYFQLKVGFETADSMGANFINSVLEKMASLMKEFYSGIPPGDGYSEALEIIMSILSNYTPSCIVECFIETDIPSLGKATELYESDEFARKFKKAVEIASIDIFRAVTHNKGILNGIDSVVLATANDFRAVEAAAHAYASRSGQYKSLSEIEITGNTFRMSLEVPLSIGTVGGLTNLHPMAKWSFEILNNPGAGELMMIIASAGLACNFSAIRSLISGGIQEGHMKMHLGNILSFLKAGEDEKKMAIEYFRDQKISHYKVKEFLNTLKNIK